MRLLLVTLLLALAGCSSSSDTPVAAPPTAPHSWLGLDPGDARAYHGPAGELVLIPVDETYAIDDTNASAVTWRFAGDDYTTDYYVEDADGTVWWYGRRGSWRAGRHGETPRELPIVDHRITFGDRTITLSDDGGPVRLETPEGVFTP